MFRKKKGKKLEEKVKNLSDSLYLQISMYKSRSDTKYHRGIIDALISVRNKLEELLKGEV